MTYRTKNIRKIHLNHRGIEELREFKSGRKSAELIGEPSTPTTVFTEQTIKTDATMILDDPHLTVRQLDSLLDILIGSVLRLVSDDCSFP